MIQQLELSNNYSSGLQNQIDSLITLQENSTLFGYNDIALDMPFGWSMFGYTCISPIDVMDAFIQISDKVIILKDEFNPSRTDLILKIMILSATFELMFNHKTPINVIVSEYVKISNFFLETAHKAYLNAILDKISKNVRKDSE